MNASPPLSALSFLIVPWDADFVAALHRRINAATQQRADRAVVVLPHDRPRRYLLEAFRAEGRALMLPRMLTVRELFAALRPAAQAAQAIHANGPFLREAGIIDRIALLHACCRETASPGDPLAERLLHGGEAAFFPWGERLAALLEECLNQDVTPTDLAHAEAEVAPFGAALLAALGRIFRLYVERLPQSGRTTPGLDAYLAARLAVHTPQDAELPAPLCGKRVFLAGFHTLTGTEERVFRRLWEQGACVMLHSDPALAANGEAHWACAGHARWIAAWRARTELAGPPGWKAGHGPRLHFFSGYDLHSQLEQLAGDLRDQAGGFKAVALTHPDLLLPVLHHLPDKDCNVSLGYPFERTLLYRLIDAVLRVEEQRREDGRTPWRALSALIGHPWLRLLQPATCRDEDDTGEDESASFTALLRRLDEGVRRGGRFRDPEDLAAAARECAPEEPALAALLDRVLECCLRAWRRAQSLSDMADCLSGLADLLGTRGRAVWRRFPLDAECLTRLAHNVIPLLRDNELATAPLPQIVRHGLLRTLLRAERVPFAADPITGLQVLGMLETRLLRFPRVFVVDATEDRLPGPPPRDPLLPDSLRGLIGLPDTQHRDQLAAHTFHRLLAGADDVFIYWQESVRTSGLLDTARQRSRLVEELLWREEQRAGCLLEPGRAPLRTAAPRLVPPRRQRLSLARTPALHAGMASVLAAGLTPARLDAYLSCPLAFHYGHVAGLSAPDTVNEGDDPAAVGELLHAVLREAYEPWLHKPIRRGDISPEHVAALFRQTAAQPPHAARLADLPPESAAMLSLAGPERLRRYLRAQPDQTLVRCLEHTLRAPCLPGDPQSPVLRGRLDRVDERNGAIILDYKTGRLKTIARDVWTDAALWARLRGWLAPENGVDPDGDALLLELAARTPSLQLPAYIHLYRQSPDLRATFADPDTVDAAWVDLGDHGREVTLFGPDCDAALREEAVSELIPLLLAFIVQHMRAAPYYRTHEGAHCGWCSFKNLCMLVG